MNFLHGLTITPPVIGRISIGGVADDLTPYQANQFTVTSLCQAQDHSWHMHPMDAELRKKHGENEKLRSIPVRLLFDDPDLNFRVRYTAFETGTCRPICAGDGCTAIRNLTGEPEHLACPGAERCEFGINAGCKAHARLYVQIEGQQDFLGLFLHRTSGFNTTRYISSRLNMLSAMTGNRIAGFPLSLKYRAKSAPAAGMEMIGFVDLEFREGQDLPTSIQQYKDYRSTWEGFGWDRDAFEVAAKAGIANGSFEDTAEDGVSIVQEFYPRSSVRPAQAEQHQSQPRPLPPGAVKNRSKLDLLAERIREAATEEAGDNPPTASDGDHPVEAETAPETA